MLTSWSGLIISFACCTLLGHSDTLGQQSRRSPSKPGSPPHVLLIMVDDLGKEWISAYGSESITTPSVDTLAQTGLTFDNFYCMPQCTPTRLTLLTGQYPFRHGWVNHWDVPRWGGGCSFDPDRNPSIGVMLRQAGYATAAAGKWQIDDFRQEPLAMQHAGFDAWCMWTGFETGNPASGKRYWHPFVVAHADQGFAPIQRGTLEERFGPQVFTQFLIDFMRAHHDQGPMFLYYPMVLTHGPLVGTPKNPSASSDLDRHRAMVQYTDHLTGQLVDALTELGIREETLVLWTTDNGTSRSITGDRHGRRVRGGKSQTTEPGVCVPLIASWPGVVPQGKRSHALVDMTDLLPTLAQLSGASPPAHHSIDGRSFANVLLGKTEKSTRSWIMAMGGRNEAALSDRGVENRYWYRDRVLRDERFKLYWSADRTVEKLIDLKHDPDESRDVQSAEDPATQRARKRLTEAAKSFPQRDNDPRYKPLPKKPWYREPTVESQTWKTGYPAD